MSKKRGVLYNLLKFILGLVTLFFIWPIYWMISGSFKNLKVGIEIPIQFFPKDPIITNYTKLFGQYPAFRWFFNSCLICVITTILVLLLSSMAAYSLAKIKFRGSKYIFAAMIAAMTLPHAVLFIPIFNVINNMGFSDTYLGAILPALAWPFGVFLLKQFMSTLPNSLLDSGRIDGCTEFRLYTRIVMPLSKPGLGALAIFTFVNSWNDYVWQLIVLKNINMYTLPLGIQLTQKLNEMDTDYGRRMAGAVVATIPVLIVFTMFQKYFTKGITLGAVKG